MLTSFARHAQRQLVDERMYWTVNKILLVTLILVALWVHNVTRLSAYYLQPDAADYYILRDLGFDVIPSLRSHRNIADLVFLTTFFLGGIVVYFPLIYPGYPTVSYMALRAVITYVVLGLMRTGCYIFTVLPAPANQCHPDDPDYDKPDTAGDILVGAKFFSGCGDLIYSGHVIMITITTFFFWHYGRLMPHPVFYNVWRWLLVFGCVASSVFIVSTRNHYTVDVVVAWMITLPYIYASYLWWPD